MEQWGAASDRSTIHQAARDLYVNASPSPSPGLAALVVPEEVTHPVRGRDDLLASLTAAVELGGQVIVLHGNGGHGKTTVAVEFARRAAVEVWWVDATSATNVIEGLREVALRAGADEQAVRNAWSGASSAPELLWRALDARTEPWLLVVDNADDPRLLAPNGERVATGRGWLRTPKSTGTVLITSRDGRRSEWGDRTFTRVDVLAVEDAARVLLDLAPGAGAEAEARELAELLGGLPLGLRLAGHYLRSTSQAVRLPGLVQPRTFAEYGQALADGVELGEHEALAGTWELSLDLLARGGHTLARPLLRLLSTFAPAPIPVELLDATVLADSETFAGITAQRLTDLVEGLRGLGLVDYQADALVVHPLVRDANLRQASGYDDLRLAMLTKVVEGLEPRDPRTWPLWRALLPTCLQLPASAYRLQLKASTFCQVAWLDAEGELLERSVLAGLTERFGEESRATLAWRRLMATMARGRGRHEVADAEYRALLAVQQEAFGPDDPETVITRRFATRDGREPGPTEAELRAVVAERTGALGARHPEVLKARRDLALAVAEQGRQAEAMVEYRALFQIRREVLGDEHLDTQEAWGAIGRLLLKMGDVAEGDAELRALLPVQLRTLGPEHPSTLNTRLALVEILIRQGKFEALRDELREVLPIFGKVWGPDHHVTVAIRRTAAELGALLANPSP